MIAGKKYSAEHIVIGTGSKEFVPPIKGLQQTGFWTSDDAVKLAVLPKSIIIIGAGPVGTEFSQIFSAIGVAVTLIQKGDQILQRDEPESARLVAEHLKASGVEVVLNADVAEVKPAGRDKVVLVKIGEGEKEYQAEALMVATGRRANLEPLALDRAGVVTDERGRLVVNDYLQTSVPHIWAAGDAAGKWQFTHTASYEGDLVGRNICESAKEKADYRVVPRVTFCVPEVASVGMTEKEAQDAGLEIKVGLYKSGGLGRYLIEGDRKGFVKIIADSKSQEIYGGHIAGANAGQLIHEIALAMRAKVRAGDLGRMIHAYPTFSEAVAGAGEKFLD
jgi:pyruvate/2-oxoglutarate dehydrogenase complex dihydrolipoamide dehydrogenase (E3) component